MTKSTSIVKATFFVLIASLGFGAISVLTLLTNRAGTSLVDVMAWRYLLAIGVVGVTTPLRGIRTVPAGKIGQLILLGGGGQALLTFVSLSALDYIPVASLAFLFYTYPAWVALLGAVTGSERLTLWRVAALTLALTGVAIMVGAPGSAALNRAGVALAIAASVLYAFYLPLLRNTQRGIPPRLATFFIVLGAALCFWIGGVTQGGVHLPSQPAVWGEILLLAVFSTGVAFTALIAGLAILGPVRTAIISTVEPFFTAVLGVVVLQDQLLWTTLLGGMLIIIAVLLIEWSSSTRRDPSPAS